MPGSGNIEIVLIFLIGTIAMIVLAGAIFFFFITYQKRILKKELEINIIKSKQQDELLKNTILSQEKERKRIAQDLHDEVGAMLSVVKLNVSLFERKCDDIKAKELANETKSYLDDLITQVRRISRDLMPPSLEKLGLAIACEELAEWINKSGIIKVDFWCSRVVRRLENKKELAIFRITQELLNNSIKHSGASQISLKIRFSKTGFVLAIRDNGRGFETDKLLKTGLGLKNLESRAKILGAKYKIDSSPGKGTRAFLFLTSKDESDE